VFFDGSPVADTAAKAIAAHIATNDAPARGNPAMRHSLPDAGAGLAGKIW
jgi:hypothetical protein